jgi:hypothetical protein
VEKWCIWEWWVEVSLCCCCCLSEISQFNLRILLVIWKFQISGSF